ncbi:hypothetical protein HXX76_014923 [Chlamydomonas incerta]|uniref:Uncharacterized protein n=1 Tax=Chlamydomonas incerta TaxID=51695 RepID=A0A835SBM0_CHLIN|nr:hypothetical protein HXX76_014923 [Chlamydomonas incerta]|eukprot:KAG2423984.1 hypothetical protein HXX76_014923 [Chlamydomonas incerta]
MLPPMTLPRFCYDLQHHRRAKKNEYARAWYAANRAVQMAKQRARYAANRAVLAAKKRARYAANRAVWVAKQQARRAAVAPTVAHPNPADYQRFLQLATAHLATTHLVCCFYIGCGNPYTLANHDHPKFDTRYTTPKRGSGGKIEVDPLTKQP